MARPVWIEVNLNNLIHNLNEVKRVVKKGTLITAVIKADGYGHGARIIAKTLLENGANRFAVATFSEALELRKTYKETPILVLGYTLKEDYQEASEKDITLTVYSYEQAKYINDKQLDIKIHLKIDTGMRRLGFLIDDDYVEELIKTVKLPNLLIEGIYTHFAMADEKDKQFTKLQVLRYEKALEIIKNLGVDIPIKHVANSAAIIDHPEYNYDMVRAGIMLYGLYPSYEVNKSNVNLKQVMSLKAKVSSVRTIESGEGVSYGLIYKANKKEKIASLPLGYADGFTRLLTSKAKVYVNGEKRPIIGRVCMDQCIFSADEVDVKMGDIVELFGDNIAIDEVADQLGTINYEIICMMSKRIPRLYLLNGEEVEYNDYIVNDL